MIHLTRHLAITLFLAWPSTIDAMSYDLIVCGQGGDSDYVARFQEWGLRLRSVLTDTLDHPADHIVLLTESGTHSDGTSDRATVLRRLAEFRARLTPEDHLFIYLIGHGTYRQMARFNVRGPDLTTEDLVGALSAVPGHTTLINTASTSAPFIKALAGPNRTICTSTKSVDEYNATSFAEYFIQGLEDGSADRDRDDRISILEACHNAATLPSASYAAEGILATEHALIDGDGKERSIRLDAENKLDNHEADRVFLKDWSFPDAVPDAWIDAYRTAVDSVEVLIRRKNTLEEETYWRELEKRLLKAARSHRRVREHQIGAADQKD